MNIKFRCKIVNFSLNISLNICFGCSKEVAMVLLSTHNICFG